MGDIINPFSSLFVIVLLLAVGVVKSLSPLEFGMEMSVRSYDSVCWYENLKQFPNTNTSGYNKCGGQVKYQMNQIMTQDFFKKNPDKKQEYFGKWTDDKAIGKLPPAYKEACSKYLKDAKDNPASDEGEALNDGSGGTKDYPYRAYAYCLLATLRKQRGDKAIEAVKNEKTVNRKNWMQAILDRDNEFRGRHGAEAYQIVKDLNTAAQTWADKMAKECNMEHSDNDDPGRQWKGNGTGESLFSGKGEDDKEVSAYQASDGWYEEIKDYPYPDGFQGNDDSLFEKIGHFTQTVWKESKFVGYGYGFNGDCKESGAATRYIAARYSPAGNSDGGYVDNVGSPKD